MITNILIIGTFICTVSQINIIIFSGAETNTSSCEYGLQTFLTFGDGAITKNSIVSANEVISKYAKNNSFSKLKRTVEEARYSQHGNNHTNEELSNKCSQLSSLEINSELMVQLPNPCLNGGTHTMNNSHYVCLCPKRFIGKHCEIRVDICDQTILPNEKLPCAVKNMSCRPVPGGGFVCNLHVASNDTHTNENYCTQLSCPKDWECMNLGNKLGGYRCEPPLDGSGTCLLEEKSKHLGRVRRSSDVCVEFLCHNGAICEKSNCICLPHFTGSYCEQTIDYCLGNPCLRNVPCQSRLGGYNCICPPTHIGIHCLFYKRKAIKPMKNPNFIYSPQQYVGMESPCCFYTTYVGVKPIVMIITGEGNPIILKRSHFKYVQNAYEELRKYFFPPISVPLANLYLAIFNLTFRTEGFHNITVKAFNHYYIVYNSTYVAHVDESRECHLSTRLKNSVHSAETATVYERKNHISIFSAVRVDCSHVKLKFNWFLYKVNNFEDEPTHNNLYNIGHNISTNNPHLNIPPFTLVWGSYTVCLVVNMTTAQDNVSDSIYTWFIVTRSHLVVTLEGGSVINARPNEYFSLDASRSYDPNFSKKQQKPLNFTWYCTLVQSEIPDVRSSNDEKYCSSTTAIPETGPILTVPPNILKRDSVYIFTVIVSVTETNDYMETETFKQQVMVGDENSPLIRLKCLRNCNLHRANPDDVTSIEATCISCNKTADLQDFSWNVFTADDSDGINVSSSEFGFESRNLLLYEGTLRNGLTYSLTFKGAIKNNIRTEGEIGSAEQLLPMNDPPRSGFCFATPQRGFAMLTNFSVHCYNFSDENQPLLFEVAHFINIDDLDTSGVFVGYDIGPDIDDITLGPGLIDFDFITTLRVIITDSLGLYTFYEYNVTVLPVIFYLKDPYDILHRIEHIVTGDQSPLGMLLASHHDHSLVQLVLATALTLEDFVESDAATFINITTLSNTIEHIRNCLADYLIREPISYIPSLKHRIAALDMVLKGPKRKIISEASIVGRDMLTQFATVMDDNWENNMTIPKIDMQDMGITMLSIASSLFEKPEDVNTQSVFQYQRDTGTENKQPAFDLNTDYTAQASYLLKYTNQILKNVFAFSHHFLPYKVPYERTSLIGGPGISLLIRKTSPGYYEKETLIVKGVGGVNPMFPQNWTGKSHKNHIVQIEILFIDQNPYWWHPSAPGINFPIIFVKITELNNTPLSMPMNIELQPLLKPQPFKKYGMLEIHPYWTLNDYDIQIYRVMVPKGGKLLVEFGEIKDNLKIQIVVKRGIRPELHDFWTESVIIPQQSQGISKESALSLYVDDAAKVDDEFFYIGILPNIDTIQILLEMDVSKSIFPETFTYEDEDNSEYSTEPKSMKIYELSNVTLPFDFHVYSIQCLNWDELAIEWATTNCMVSPGATTEMALCLCQRPSTTTASFRSLQSELHMFQGIRFFITFLDNPLILFMVIFTLILFLGLLGWGVTEDHRDKFKRYVMFLADNNPLHEYCYLLMVQTGRRARAETSSHVALRLQGTDASSETHVLMSSHHKILTRNAQDWFVLKTAKSLGDLQWIHIWHDYTGANPSWYCNRIIVHDIQTHHVWFFVAEQWFAPLHEDGKMSFSIFKETDLKVFARQFRFMYSVTEELDNGQHGWFSIFYRHPYSNYTRCQRICVALTHAIVIMFIIIEMHELPVHDDPVFQINDKGSYKWDWLDVIHGIYAALIAFPIHIFLIAIFRCVTPLSEQVISDTHYQDSISKYSNSKTFSDEIYLTNNAETDSSGELASEREEQIGVDKLTDNDYHEQKLENSFSSIKSNNIVNRRQHTLPFHWSTTYPKRNMATDLEVYYTYKTATTLKGQRRIQERHCLPSWFIYISWFIIIVILIPCIYVTLLYGVSYGWVVSIHFLIICATAILISIFILETLKLLVCASYHTFLFYKELIIEDRSDLVYLLKSRDKVSAAQLPERLHELDRLHKNEIYKPIQTNRAELLKRNAAIVTLAKGIILNLSIYFLLAIMLAYVLHGLRDSLGYYTVWNVRNLISGQKAYGKTTLHEINCQEDLVHYLNDTLLPAIHAKYYYNNKRLLEIGQTMDTINYLVGVPRLRQIRYRPQSCIKVWRLNKSWVFSCKSVDFLRDFDNKSYGPSWKEYSKRKNNHSNLMWLHKSWSELGRPTRIGNNSLFSGGGYEAKLGHTIYESQLILTYLVTTGWLDHLTRALVIEFPLYNPNRNLVSVVSLFVDSSDTGLYTISCRVELVKVHPASCMTENFVIVMFTILIILLIYCVVHKSDKIVQIQPQSYFGNIGHSLTFIVMVSCIAVTIIYLCRTVLLTSPIEKLAHPETEKFVDFYLDIFWNNLLITTIALTLFFVIIKVSHFLSFIFNYHLNMKVLKHAFGIIMATLLFFTVALSGFAILAYVMFVTIAFKFRSFVNSFIALLAFTKRHFQYQDIAHSTYGSIGYYMPQLFYITFFMIFILIIFWVFAAILIDIYRNVSIASRKRKFIYFDDDYNDLYISTSSVSRARLLAMQRILEELLQSDNFKNKKYIISLNEKDHTTSLKSIAMCSVIVNAKCCRNFLRRKKQDHILPVTSISHSTSELLLYGMHNKEKEAVFLLRTYLITESLKMKLHLLEDKIDLL